MDMPIIEDKGIPVGVAVAGDDGGGRRPGKVSCGFLYAAYDRSSSGEEASSGRARRAGTGGMVFPVDLEQAFDWTCV